MQDELVPSTVRIDRNDGLAGRRDEAHEDAVFERLATEVLPRLKQWAAAVPV